MKAQKQRMFTSKYMTWMKEIMRLPVGSVKKAKNYVFLEYFFGQAAPYRLKFWKCSVDFNLIPFEILRALRHELLYILFWCIEIDIMKTVQNGRKIHLREIQIAKFIRRIESSTQNWAFAVLERNEWWALAVVETLISVRRRISPAKSFPKIFRHWQTVLQ